MNEELIAKAKQADSPEEIMKIAEENDIEMGKEEAEMIYKQLHTSGEVSDEELESVAGGCTGSGGKTIVTSACKCFTGQFEQVKVGHYSDLGSVWSSFSGSGGHGEKKVCGECTHLTFKNGIGYCGVE